MEEWFPYLMQSGKTLMPVDCAKSHMYIVICRKTTEETIQGEALSTVSDTEEIFSQC